MKLVSFYMCLCVKRYESELFIGTAPESDHFLQSGLMDANGISVRLLSTYIHIGLHMQVQYFHRKNYIFQLWKCFAFFLIVSAEKSVTVWRGTTFNFNQTHVRTSKMIFEYVNIKYTHIVWPFARVIMFTWHESSYLPDWHVQFKKINRIFKRKFSVDFSSRRLYKISACAHTFTIFNKLNIIKYKCLYCQTNNNDTYSINYQNQKITSS